ncbi:MAG: hypothetical protein M3Q65_15280 [Chloroflexota bacterium]|nr:hypothetical protein [Chloroflexota bacterium]
MTGRGLAYWRMSVHNAPVTAGERLYALAGSRRQYIIYAGAGGTFAVDLALGAYTAP